MQLHDVLSHNLIIKLILGFDLNFFMIIINFIIEFINLSIYFIINF